MPLVLLVEPDDALRGVLCQCLARHDYRVLPAVCATEAEGLTNGRSVDLLMTEVNLSDSTGAVLAALLGAERSPLRVLFTSGAGDDVSVPLLVKPFSPVELLEKVREVLPPTR